MFGMGWQEILIILVIAVLVIGPEQLPQVARTAGKLMAQFRRATNDLRDTINREINEREEFKEFQEFSRTLDSEVRDAGHTAQTYVEREVAREEAELAKLEADVKQGGTESEPAPSVPGENWAQGPGDFPAGDDAPNRTATAAEPGEPEPAKANGGARKEGGAHKETA